jgi:hypothetical protein
MAEFAGFRNANALYSEGRLPHGRLKAMAIDLKKAILPV